MSLDDGDSCENCGSTNTEVESDCNSMSYWNDLVCNDCKHKQRISGGSEL